jgi:hypothetical protein
MKGGAAHYPLATAPGSYKNLTSNGRVRCSTYSVLAYWYPGGNVIPGAI